MHYLRRAGSSLLNEVGLNGGRIEKCLAQEEERPSRSAHDKAEYTEQLG